MKAAYWYGHKDIRVLETDEPSPKSGQVKIRVAWAGICGTDRHEYVGPNFIPTSRPHRLTGRTAPLIMGHEFTGEIVEVAPDVKEWAVGMRVCCSGTLCCGKCRSCLEKKRPNVCEKLGFTGVSDDGAFAEYVVVNAYQVYAIPEGLDMRTVVLAEPLACGQHAVNLLGGVRDETVLINGSGIIGLSAFLACKVGGAREIALSGWGPEKRALVEGWGGTYLDVSTPEGAELLQQLRVSCAFECVGMESTLRSAISALLPTGKLMVMGVFEQEPCIPMNDFQEGERTLYTSQAYNDEIGEVMHYMAEGRYPDLEPLITAETELEDLVEKGFEELNRNAARHAKVIIRISGKH